MDDITDRVLRGEIDRPTAHAIVACQNTVLRCIELHRKLEEGDVRREWEEVKRELGISA